MCGYATGTGRLRTASWRPASLAVPQDVLLPCAWLELEGLAKITVGLIRARVYVRDLDEEEPDGRLVLCPRGALGAIQVEGLLAPVADALAARTRAAMLRLAAVHRGAGRPEEAQAWRARAPNSSTTAVPPAAARTWRSAYLGCRSTTGGVSGRAALGPFCPVIRLISRGRC